MMKSFIALVMLFGLFGTTYLHAQNVPTSIYDVKVKALDGTTVIDFSKFRGKKILIVNTASNCGYTPQYESLEKLYVQEKGKLVIVGFPANNFFQERGSNKDIASFCQKNYGVTFPMAEKIDVIGKNKHPLYLFLTDKKYNKVMDSKVKWNFQKYLVDEKGNLINMFTSGVDPLSDEVVKAIHG